MLYCKTGQCSDTPKIQAHARDVAQLTTLNSPPLASLSNASFSCSDMKVTCYLWGFECITSFCFQVWLDIWKTRKDVQEPWLMRMEQSQSVEWFNSTEWYCQWQFLHTQTHQLVFKVVHFMQLNGVLVHNIFGLTHHFSSSSSDDPFRSIWFCKELLDIRNKV